MPTAHVVVILDRSGSMQPIRDDVIGGFNAFLAAQQAQPGGATLTLIQFDSQNAYEVVHRFTPIGEVPQLDAQRFVPRGGTPLFDALGRGIVDLEVSLAAMPEVARPERVVFAALTDGKENASHEFSRAVVRAMIRDKTDRGGWEFRYLSADVGAVLEAIDLGVARENTQLFSKDAKGTQRAFRSLTESVTKARKGRKRQIGFAASEPTPAGRT